MKREERKKAPPAAPQGRQQRRGSPSLQGGESSQKQLGDDMTDLALTAGERSVLRTIDEAPEKRVAWSALPKKADLTQRGFAIVATRMIRRINRPRTAI